MTVSTAHLHLGPGRLGTGLIAYSSRSAKFPLHLVARPQTALPKAPRFEVLECGVEEERVIPIDFDSFSRADTVDDLAPAAREAITTAGSMLVTTTITTRGIAARQPLLLDVAAARQTANCASTTFIACENDPGPALPGLVRGLEALGVDCRRTMVNRLCLERKRDQRPGVKVTRVDELAEWLIEGEASSLELARLEQLPWVRFVPNIEPYELRKRWLVNGAHLAAALRARAHNYPTLDMLANLEDHCAWLEAVQASLTTALCELVADLPEDVTANALEYGRSHIAVWSRHDDDVARILSRLTRQDLRPLMTDIGRKLGEPAARYCEPGRPLAPELRETFDHLHDILKTREQYADYRVLGRAGHELDGAVDDEVALRYFELLRSLFGEAEAERRRESLQRSLLNHREGLNHT